MAGPGPIKVGFALVIVFSVIIDQAISSDKCRSGCIRESSQHFKYVEGTTYKYNYEGTIDISVSSAEAQRSTTKVRATVLLSQLPLCNQVLKIQNMQVIGGDGKKHGEIPDIGKPVRLNFQEGQLEDAICAEESDTQNSLNVKRAIASMLQSAFKRSYETDVFGTCPTEFSTHKDGNVFVIKKTRNLNKCEHRESMSNDFVAATFDLNSEIKTSPILKGDYVSEQRIKNGIVDHVTITENYLFVPYSAGADGAKAHVQSKLTLAGQSKEKVNANVDTPKSIIFENPHPMLSATTNVNTVLRAMKDAAESTDTIVKEDSAKKFSDLIRVLRTAKKADLLTVFNQVRAGAGFSDKKKARQIFLDGLFRAGNGDTIEVAIELYRKKQLNELESKLFFLGLSFVKHVTPSALKAASNLVNTPDLPREALLGIGTLVNRFCRAHDCTTVEELVVLLNNLFSKISVKTVRNRKTENTVLAVLKAISNTKYIPENLATKIIALAQDKNGPSRIRVAALESYFGNPCSEKFRDSALNILKDIQQDSEIRIKAYLAAVQCPNGKVASAIKTLLDNEPSYQVGGYIVTHLRTIKTSANPDKAFAKSLLGRISTAKSYPFDRRKYSFNDEFSYAFDTLGLGSSIESNVIYSQKSFLPRSTSLNLTAELFGHAFNFLEIDTRQENVDKLIEHYLGPLGVLRKESSANLLRKGKEEIQNLMKNIGNRFNSIKSKREVPKAQLDYIIKQLGEKQNELNKDLDLDLSVKLFGSEVLFLSFNEDSTRYNPDELIDKIFDVIDKRTGDAKNFDDIVRSNVVFLDSEVAYPTSLGFPLRLNLEGSSSIQVRTAANIDVKSILARKDSVIKFTLVPSANIQLSGRFTLDAAVVQSGLKVTGNVHTSTGASLEWHDSEQAWDIKLTLPVEKQQIISASHELVFETRELGGPEADVPLKFIESKDFSICVDHLSSMIGLTFCGEINQPNVELNQGALLPFPLNGNSKLSVYIEKNDLAYFLYKDREYVSDDKLGAEASFEVMGEHNKKKLNVDVAIFARPETYFKATLESDIKKATLEGRIVNTNAEKSILARFGFDNFEYYGRIGAVVSGNQQRQIYKPVIEFKLGQDPVQKSPYNIEGQIVVVHGDSTKYTFGGVKLIIPNQKPISIEGDVEHKPQILSADLKLSDGEKSGSFKGLIQLLPEDFKIKAELQNSINPQANFNVNYELKSDQTGASSNLLLIHGKDLSSQQNKLKLSNSYKSVSGKGKGEREFKCKNHLSYPLFGVDADFDVELNAKLLKYDADLKYRNIKLGSELELKIDRKGKDDYELDFELYGFNNKLKIESECEVNGYKSKMKHKIIVNAKALEVAGTVNNLVQDDNINVATDLTVKLTGYPDMKCASSFKYDSDDFDSFLKLSSSTTDYVDLFYKINKADDHDGSVKINLKDILIVDGQIKGTKGSGNSHILVELPKYQRKIKSESTFTLQDPIYNLDLTLYTNFEKDNSRKYRITTQNNLKPDSVDTKNVIYILEQKYEANFKGGYNYELGDCDAVAKLVLAKAVDVDASYKVSKGKDHDGKLKIDFKEILVFDGQFDAGEDSGNGQVLVELPKHKRKIKSEFSATVRDPVYNVDFKLYPNFEKGDGRKYRISTESEIKSDSIDSKGTSSGLLVLMLLLLKF